MKEKIMIGFMTATILAFSAFLLTSCNSGTYVTKNAHTCYEVERKYEKIPFIEYDNKSYPNVTFIVDGVALNKNNILGYYEDLYCNVLYIKYVSSESTYQITRYVNTPYEVRYAYMGER